MTFSFFIVIPKIARLPYVTRLEEKNNRRENIHTIKYLPITDLTLTFFLGDNVKGTNANNQQNNTNSISNICPPINSPPPPLNFVP